MSTNSSTNSAVHIPPSFNRLAWSNLAAQSAEQIALAAGPIVAVLSLGAGAGATGILQTAQTLPFLLFAIPAGVLADRMSRRTLMAAAEGLRTVSLLVILVLTATHALSLSLLAMLGLIGACGTVAFSVAGPALVPALVPRQALITANGRIELARTVAFAAGPALGGALVGMTTGSAAFGLAMMLSAVAVALLIGVPEPERQAAPRRHPLQELREGAAFVFSHPLLRPIFVTQFVFNAAFFMLQAVYVPYAIRRLGLDATGVGLTLACFGVGMILGALMARHVALVLRFGTVISIGPIAGLLAAGLMVATIRVPSPVIAGLAFFLIGVGPILWVISTTTLRQAVTPRDLLGRVSAINIMATGARPVGAAAGALIGGLLGAEACLVVAAIGFLIQAIVILISPAARLVEQPA
jgi:predicted MFS family arabinose efflux permease